MVGFCLVIVLSARQTGYAGATAVASGHFGETPGQSQTVSGATEAETDNLDVSDDSFDKFISYAHVRNTHLKAYAYAEYSYLPFGGEGATANTIATWSQPITVRNPGLLENVPNGVSPVAYFHPSFHGDLAGGASATLSATIFTPGGGEIFDFKKLSSSGEMEIDHGVLTIRPLVAFIVPGSTFTMQLTSIATAGPSSHTSYADFFDTAYLPPIYIGDANGNPIPQLAGLEIFDDAGLRYPVTVVQKTPGDYNGNGVVDIADYVVWRNSIGQTGPILNADGDGDQLVDAFDYQIWRENFGQVAVFSGGSGAGAQVPEPAAAVVIVPALLCVASIRGRWRAIGS